MDSENSRKKELDDFWDISELVPTKRMSRTMPRSTDAVEVISELKHSGDTENNDDIIIKRYIPPHSESSELKKRMELEEIERYTPENSLIHKVIVFKHKTAYNYYSAFLKTAEEYMDRSGSPCDYIPFFSYVPQYDQMNDEQLAYYLWFRENVRSGSFIKTDQGYLLLYIFELLNLSKRLNVRKTQYILMSLWNEYGESFPSALSRLPDWICDFSLLHHLPPPINLSSNIIKKVISLKEYYITLPTGDVKRCAQTLMRYCSSYDYRTSKFFNEQSKALFDKYITGALCVAITYYSTDGKILSGLDFDDSTITRDAYAGALCVADERYRIEVSYCSFSRSNELRFLVGDIIKYSENKLRAFLGIKSKMTVYSITIELRRLLDDYFLSELPSKRKSRQTAVERHDYDVLYDIQKKPLSLSDAARIEEGSWETTKELIAAFEEAVESVEATLDTVAYATQKEDDIATASVDPFAAYRTTIEAMINGDGSAILRLSKTIDKMPDSIVDEINEIAYEVFGDLFIDDDGMGNYTVVEDYKEQFMKGV